MKAERKTRRQLESYRGLGGAVEAMDARRHPRTLLRILLSALAGLALCFSESSATGQTMSGAIDDTWTWSGTGMTDLDVHLLAGNDRSGSKLFAAGNSGIFSSADGGTTWHLLESFPGGAYALAVSPADPNIVYAVPQAKACWFNDRNLYKSIDGGISWTVSVSPPFSGTNICGFQNNFSKTIVPDPKDSNTIYLVGLSYIDGDTRLFKTTVGGLNWGLTFLPFGGPFVIDPGNTAELYFGATYDWSKGSIDHTLKSVDGGANWFTLSAAPGTATLLAVDPSHKGVVYSVMSSGGLENLYKSRDGGETWLPAGRGLEAVFGSKPRSEDEVSLASNLRATALAIDPTGGQNVFVATPKGVYRSIDGAEHWAPFSAGLGSTDVRDLTILSSGTLVAATAGGIYRIACCSTGAISASPDACQLSAGLCTTYLNWHTEHIRDAQVWVRINDGPEVLYAAMPSCTDGNCPAPWIQGGVVYTFTLYDCSSVICTDTDHGNAPVVGAVRVTAQ